MAGVGIAYAIDMLARNSLSDFGLRLVYLAALYVTLAVSLNLINGITGQFSIGHAAFYQVGAYASGYVTVNFFSKAHMSNGIWFGLMLFVGAIAASIAGLAVGLPSLRLRGDYLAVVTLGFGEIIRIISQNVKEVGAASGMPVDPHAKTSEPLIWLALLLAFVCIAVCRNLLKTAHGLPFLAVRDDEIASSAMGVRVTNTKVIAFVIGSAFAGAAGAIYAHNEGFLLPASFTMETSFIILTMVVLGGTGSITGSVVAAIFLSSLPELLRDLKQVPIAGLIGAAIALVAVVTVLRKLAASMHKNDIRKTLTMVGTIAGGVVLTIILRFALEGLPFAKGQSIEGSRLRIVIFAVTLVVLMLLRPQGMFAHHEFSWDFLSKLFKRNKQKAVVV